MKMDDDSAKRPRWGLLCAFALLGVMFFCLAAVDMWYLFKGNGSDHRNFGDYMLHGYVIVFLSSLGVAFLLGPSIAAWQWLRSRKRGQV